MIDFPFKPSQATYSVKPLNNLVEYQTYGFAIQRVQAVSSVYEVTVSIQLHDQRTAQFFWSFWRLYNSRPSFFKWDIMTDGFNLEPHKCQIIPDTLATSTYNGHIYEVSFSVRAKAIASRNLNDDLNIITVENSGLTLDIIDRLHYIINVQCPADLRKKNAL